jgi:ABC-2 type transport system permease protein
MKLSVFKYIRITLRYLSVSWQRDVAYKANLLISFGFSGIYFLTQILTINIYLTYYDSFLGYSRSEMIFLAGLGILNISLIWNLLHNLSQIPSNVTEGGLDRYLLKPMHPIFLTIVNEFNIENIFSTIFGLFFIAISLPEIHFVLTPLSVFSFLLSEVMLFFSMFGFVWTIMNLSFWLGNIDNIYWVIDTLADLKKFPFKSYQGAFFFFFVLFFPAALFAAVQLDILTGRMSVDTLLVILVSSVVWFTLAILSWNLGLKRYTSASGGGSSAG